MNLKSVLHLAQESIELSLYSEREKKYIIELFVLDQLQISKAQLITKMDQIFSSSFQEVLLEKVQRLNHYEPFQYILNKENFFGHDFYVDKNVLIPRPETEELVEWILDYCQNQRQIRILDIGTGSGCIPISIQKQRPDIVVDAIDISKEALQIAEKNNSILETKVHFFYADIRDEEQWACMKNYDIIVSNPPYIPYHEKNLMNKNVLDFEPGLALFVENDKALIFYEKISKFAQEKLKTNGALFFECNEFNAKNVKDLLIAKEFENIVLKKDYFGKNRMIKAEVL